jgi:hypothetical protein
LRSIEVDDLGRGRLKWKNDGICRKCGEFGVQFLS